MLATRRFRSPTRHLGWLLGPGGDPSLWRLPKAPTPLRLVLQAVKHAISKLRSECAAQTTPSNHRATALTLPSFLHIDPELLLASALSEVQTRRDLAGLIAEQSKAAEAWPGGAPFEVLAALHYEDLQLNASRAISGLLGQLGVDFNAKALEPAFLGKGMREDLRAALSNFEAIDKHFESSEPCLSPMLRSKIPERFESNCGAAVCEH